MGYITLNIIDIALPATVGLLPDLGTFYDIESLGIFTINDVPDGQYTIIIVDANGCTWNSDEEIGHKICVEETTTTTTTTTIE